MATNPMRESVLRFQHQQTTAPYQPLPPAVAQQPVEEPPPVPQPVPGEPPDESEV